jgi:hypothetical protein
MLINWLLRLYPRAWRERYAEEMCALLTQHSISRATWLDLAWGALDAHLHPQALSIERTLTIIEDALGATCFGLLLQVGLGLGFGALGGWIAQMRWVFGRVDHR